MNGTILAGVVSGVVVWMITRGMEQRARVRDVYRPITQYNRRVASIAYRLQKNTAQLGRFGG